MEIAPSVEIDSQTSFERILGISASLGRAGIEHTVVHNALEEPLAIYAPAVITPEEAQIYADKAVYNASLKHPREPLQGYKVFPDDMWQRRNPPYKKRPEFPSRGPVVRMRIERFFPPIIPSGMQSLLLYPDSVGRVVEAVTEGISIGRKRRPGILDSFAEELGGGDSFPHFDYPNLGDISERLFSITPNIHITLKGKGVVSVGQVRRYSWATTLRDGIQEALDAGMSGADINNNFKSDWIRKLADPRVPESFKSGIAYLEEAMSLSSPFVELNAGDVFIFDGSQQGDCLPQVHDFRTVKVSDDPEKNKRIFAVVRPSIMYY